MDCYQIFSLIYIVVAITFMKYALASRNKRLIGGEISEHSLYNVRIFRGSDEQGICSGSILDDYHIISAAHCFVKTNMKKWNDESYLVVAGVADFNSTDRIKWVTSNVQYVYIPAKFIESLKNNEPLQGDIAVVKLQTSLNLSINGHLDVISLPENVQLSYVNEIAVVRGYGINQFQVIQNETTGDILSWNLISDGKLRFANTTVIDNNKCQNMWDYSQYITHSSTASENPRKSISEKHICAQVHQRNSLNPEGICIGDSGGSLTYSNKILIGVVSTGATLTEPGCMENEVPGVYTRVSAFKDFILKVKNDDITDDPEIFTIQPTIRNRSSFFTF